jgi:hypothetical protein
MKPMHAGLLLLVSLGSVAQPSPRSVEPEKYCWIEIDTDGPKPVLYCVAFHEGDTVRDVVLRLPRGIVFPSSSSVFLRRESLDGPPQVWPIDWATIAGGGNSETNWRLQHGDRVMFMPHLFTGGTMLARVNSPLERIMGLFDHCWAWLK